MGRMYFLFVVLGIKTTQILIYRDNFASINYLIHTHWYELKFLGVGTSVLIGVWLSKALKYTESQITDRLSKSSSYSPWQLLNCPLTEQCSRRVLTVKHAGVGFPLFSPRTLFWEVKFSRHLGFSCCSANTSHSLTGQVLVLFGAPPPCLHTRHRRSGSVTRARLPMCLL